ncbi:MAG: alkaline phosphatase family protein [Candidatus Edwardsbacteria bacterium]|nr:alkaline phosphatase family protein [Candidatus Edwardsbacteria bacterium]
MTDNTIAAITPSICALFGIVPPAISSAKPLGAVVDEIKSRYRLNRIDKCLVYAPDALGSLFLARHADIFHEVETLAPVRIGLRSVFPPKTPVCFASMFTGASPEVHGIRAYEKPVLACDTLFDALIRAGKKPAIVAVKDSSVDLIFRGREMDYYSEEYDPQVTALAIELLKTGRDDLVLAYHQEYDDALHATTHESGRALAAANNHAQSFITLCQAFHMQ